jgi:hypothetical protein
MANLLTPQWRRSGTPPLSVNRTDLRRLCSGYAEEQLSKLGVVQQVLPAIGAPDLARFDQVYRWMKNP